MIDVAYPHSNMTLTARVVSDNAATSAFIAGYVAYKGWKRCVICERYCTCPESNVQRIPIYFGKSRCGRRGLHSTPRTDEGVWNRNVGSFLWRVQGDTGR